MSRRYQNTISKLTALLLGVVFMFSTNSLQATHIVGSDMSFECLGNDFYEITLIVRRDCINGADDAPFDNPASVGIFDAFGNPLNFLGTLGQVMMPFTGQDFVDIGRPDCGYFGGPVCVEEAVYKSRVYLPFRSKGYILAYQRCCRNVTLNNIINPLETGTSKFVCLTETTLNECNSSPEFQEWPEVVICSDQPLVFDHAAFDKDGDSLAYHLFTPHSGATVDFPKPQPPKFPPYDSVTFAQGYSLDNLLGGEPLRIDPVTGTITATPNTVGQFLVGILVEEWRDGELLSKVRRDFEYNVRVCEDIAEIGFEVPELTCDGLTIQIENTSIDDFGYTWNFNYPSEDPAFISTETNPSFTYPEEGFYTVRLTSANPENDCEVEVIKEIGVFNSQITTDITCSISLCEDGQLSVYLQSNANDPYDDFDINQVNWSIIADDQAIPVNGDSVTVTIPCAEEITVTLNVTSETGCMASQTKTIGVEFPEVVIDIAGDELVICEGDSIALLASSSDSIQYTWIPTSGLSFMDTVFFSDPIASPDTTTKYTVVATNGLDSDTSMVTVIVNPNPIYDISTDTLVVCEGSIMDLMITSDQDLTYVWESTDGINATNPQNPQFSPSESTSYTVSISDGVCTVEETIYVEVIPTEVDEVTSDIEYIIDYDSLTMGLSIDINEEELRAQYDIVSIRWEVMAGDDMFAGDGSAIDITLAPDVDVAKVTYYFTDSNGCEYAITTIVVINAGDDGIIDIAGDTLYICVGESVALLNSSIQGLRYNWTPSEGLVFTDLINYSDPIASPNSDTEYTVTVQAANLSDTATVLVIVNDYPVVDISMDSIEICEGDGMDITLSSEEDLIYDWGNQSGVNINAPYSPSNPFFSPSETTTYTVNISNGFCVIERTIYVSVIPTEVDEVTESIVYTTNYDTLTGNLTISINEEQLRVLYDIVSIRWTVMAGEEMFAGDGSTIDVIIADAETAKVTYYFTDSNGCEYEITMIIVLGNNNIPSLEFIMQDTIRVCLGDTTVVLANPNSNWTYTWEPEDDLIFPSESDKSNPIFVGDSSRLYVVTVSNGIMSVTDSVFLNVITDELMLSFESETGTICDNITNLRVVNPDDSDGTTYEWSLSPTFDRVVSSEQFVAIVVDTDSARIYVRADDPKFCGSNVAFIDVFKDSLDLTVEFDPIDVCISDSTTVSVINNNPDQNVSVIWEANDRIVSGDLESNTITVRAGPSDTEITLTYIASDGVGCVVTEDVVIPVTGILVLDVMGDSISCEPMAILSVTSQEADATYEWSLSSMFDDILATGSDVALDLPSGISTVYVRGDHPAYCGSEVDSITIENNAPDFSFDYDPLNICVSNTTSIDLINNDTSQTLSLVWAASDNITSDPTALPLEIVALEGQTEIVLDYTITNNLGCELMQSLTIPVEDELIVDIIIDSVSCDGTTGTFRADVNASMASYEWSLDQEFGSILSTDSVVIVSLPQGQSIYLRAFTDLCDSNVASASLPDDPFMITSNAPDSICVGDAFELVADGGPRMFSIVWEASDNIVSSLDSSTISIVGLDNGAESIVLAYMATSTEGCETMGTIEIPYGSVVTPDPIVSVNCGTYGLTFDTGGAFKDGDILWDFGIADDESDNSMEASPTFDFGAAGTYTVMVMSLQEVCQFEPFSIEVFVPEIIILETTDELTISKCDGDTVLTIGATNNLDLPIVWTSVDGDTISISDSLTFSSADYETVIATASDTFGCSESLTFAIDAFDFGLEVVFPNGPDVGACLGENFPISIVDTTGANLSYDWAPAGSIVSGQGTADVIAVLDGPTEISVLVTNLDNGCTKELIIIPNIITLDVEAVADPDAEIFLGESVTISALSDGDIITYTWDNGSSDASQIVSPTETTTYTVMVTDVNGCTATAQITIVVIQPECNESDVFLPTAFSPNGDNTNDMLMVRSNFVEEMDLQIVDRWGEEVFRSTNQRDGWNGTYKGTGKELSPDVYAYCLKVVCIGGEEFIMTGHVSLIR